MTHDNGPLKLHEPEQSGPSGDPVTASEGTAPPNALPQLHWFPLTLIGGLIVGYALLSHYSNNSDAKGLGAALSVGPVLLIGLILLGRWTSVITALVVGAGVAALLYRYWGVVENNFEWADLAQQFAIYALVTLSFARSLFGVSVPLCEQLAVKLHGSLTLAERRYMRHATQAWALLYAAVCVTIPVLYALAPLRVWSLFVNFGVFGLILLAGMVDHALRRRWLPRHPSGGILGILQRTFLG